LYSLREGADTFSVGTAVEVRVLVFVVDVEFDVPVLWLVALVVPLAVVSASVAVPFVAVAVSGDVSRTTIFTIPPWPSRPKLGIPAANTSKVERRQASTGK
jgi:hypothetical protein